MVKWTKWPPGDPTGPCNILNMMRVWGRLVWSKHFQRNAAALMSYGDTDSSPGSWIPTGSYSWREFFWTKLCVKNCRSPWNGGLPRKDVHFPEAATVTLSAKRVFGDVVTDIKTAVRTIQGLGWWHSAHCIAQGAEFHPQPRPTQITNKGG